MTAALCTNCGGLKKGLLLPCDHCGAAPSSELSYEAYLSDHYLNIDTLKEFGHVIKRLSMVANNKLEAQWAFMYLLSEYYPEIMYTDVPKVYKTSSIILLKDLDLDPIVIKKGRLKTDKMDPESKYSTIVDYSVTHCPYCSAKKSLANWCLFNGYSDASLQPLIFGGRIFRSRCLKCHKVQSVNYDMVYFDIEPIPVMFYLDNPKADPGLQIDHIPKEHFDGLNENFLYRKVNRPIELVEKIKIFEDGLDDLEVELAKHYISMDTGLDLTDRLYYHEMKTGFLKKKQIIFRDRINELGMVSYPLNEKRKFKDHLLALMKEKVNKKNNEWPVVNHDTLVESFNKA